MTKLGNIAYDLGYRFGYWLGRALTGTLDVEL